MAGNRLRSCPDFLTEPIIAARPETVQLDVDPWRSTARGVHLSLALSGRPQKPAQNGW
jgi:hypothetical protein